MLSNTKNDVRTMMSKKVSIYHKKLFSGPSLTLGKIHWMIQKANFELESQCAIKSADGNVMHDIVTELGNEVGMDVIHWWIFKKETDVNGLEEKTNSALSHAQKLKEDAFDLKQKCYAASYEGLIDELKKFIDSHEHNINELYDYALHLSNKDALAPSMLFSYRVWGHTRRMWLTIEPGAYAVTKQNEAWEISAEFAIGLRDESGYTIDSVYGDIVDDIAEGIDPEYRGPIVVPTDRLLRQTSHMILGNLAVYCENIRESLRNITLEIENYEAPIKLLSRDSFWQSFIAWTARNNRVEEQIWDLKKTFEMFHATDQREKVKAEVGFCEQVASYANANGGALILGVTDAPPRQIVGITELENRMKFIMSTLTRHIKPKIDFVHLKQVIVKDENSADKNCMVIAIAQTKDVISVEDEGRFTYPIRLATGLGRSTFEEIKKHKESVLRDNYQFLLTLEGYVTRH